MPRWVALALSVLLALGMMIAFASAATADTATTDAGTSEEQVGDEAGVLPAEPPLESDIDLPTDSSAGVESNDSTELPALEQVVPEDLDQVILPEPSSDQEQSVSSDDPSSKGTVAAQAVTVQAVDDVVAPVTVTRVTFSYERCIPANETTSVDIGVTTSAAVASVTVTSPEQATAVNVPPSDYSEVTLPNQLPGQYNVIGYVTTLSGEQVPFSLDNQAIIICERPGDQDGDGIADTDDQCPNTPAGDTVDDFGCSVEEPDAPSVGVVAEQTGPAQVTVSVTANAPDCRGGVDYDVSVKETGAVETVSVQCGQTGSVVFDNLPPGDYTVVVSGGDGSSAETMITVVAGEEEPTAPKAEDFDFIDDEGQLTCKDPNYGVSYRYNGQDEVFVLLQREVSGAWVTVDNMPTATQRGFQYLEDSLQLLPGQPVSYRLLASFVDGDGSNVVFERTVSLPEDCAGAPVEMVPVEVTVGCGAVTFLSPVDAELQYGSFTEATPDGSVKLLANKPATITTGRATLDYIVIPSDQLTYLFSSGTVNVPQDCGGEPQQPPNNGGDGQVEPPANGGGVPVAGTPVSSGGMVPVTSSWTQPVNSAPKPASVSALPYTGVEAADMIRTALIVIVIGLALAVAGLRRRKA